MRVVRAPLSQEEIQAFADAIFGDMIKVVVDVKRELLVIGMVQHADGEQRLIQDGSRINDLWGANYFPGKNGATQIEYTSMINECRAANRGKRTIADAAIRARVRAVIARYFPAVTP